MPTPTYTNHAKRRMRERGISEEAVEEVLANYDVQRPAQRRGDEPQSVIYEGTYQGRVLKVYVERDTNPQKVKTAVWEGD